MSKRKVEEVESSTSESEDEDVKSSETDTSPKKKDRGKKILEDYAKSRPYRCTRTLDNGELCSKRYKCRRALDHHVKSVHLGIRHRCKICGQKYTSKSNLKNHIRQIHKGIKKVFKCDLCSKSYESRGNLIRHKKNSHNIRLEFDCPICNASFEDKNDMEVHVNSYHKKTVLSTTKEPLKISTSNVFSQDKNLDTISEGVLSDSRVLNLNVEDTGEKNSAVAVLVSRVTTDQDLNFRMIRINLVKLDNQIPTFAELKNKDIVDCRLFYRGARLSNYKLRNEMVKKYSFYFPVELAHYAPMSRSSLYIIEAFLDFLRMVNTKGVDQRQELEELDYSTTVNLSKLEMKFFHEMLKASKIDILFENAEEFVKRTGKAKEEFSKAAYPKTMFKNNTGFGHVYLIWTRVEGELFIYIGKNQAKRSDETGSRNGRVSSQSHAVGGLYGGLTKFRLKYPTAKFKEKILFYLNENDAETTNPLGEATAILAFFFMQHCGITMCKGETVGEKFQLINSNVVYERWTIDLINGLRVLILKFAGLRFSLIPKFKEIPDFPNIDPVFSTLNARKFS